MNAEPTLTEPIVFCLNCPPKPTLLSMNAILGVGFGSVTVSRDGEVVWSGDSWSKKVRSVERQARREPGRDWRIVFYAPLYEVEYQRHDRDTWHLIRRGEGFA